MTCKAGDVACQLGQIVDALNGWSWPAFTSTLVATLVGAAVALAGAWLLARRDRQERYATRLDEALARVLLAAAAFAQAMAEWQISPAAYRRGFPPTADELMGAAHVVQLVARGRNDIVIASFLGMAAERASLGPARGVEIARQLPQTIYEWRHGATIESTLRPLLEAAEIPWTDLRGEQ